MTTYPVDWTSPDCTFTVIREHDEALGLSTWTVEAARTVTVTELARCEDLPGAEGSADGCAPDTEADGMDAECDSADGEPLDTGDTGQAGDTAPTGAVDADTAETDGRETVASDTDPPAPGGALLLGGPGLLARRRATPSRGRTAPR